MHSSDYNLNLLSRLSLIQQEHVNLDEKTLKYVAIAAAGMTTAFIYFNFRETGVQISWKDFVQIYLSRGLVRRMTVRVVQQ